MYFSGRLSHYIKYNNQNLYQRLVKFLNKNQVKSINGLKRFENDVEEYLSNYVQVYTINVGVII